MDPPPARRLHWRLVRRRKHLLRAGSAAALFAVVGPGVLAGLSDDDPAGRVATGAVFALVAVSVGALAALTIF